MTLSIEEQLKRGDILPGQPIKFNQNIEIQFSEGISKELKEQNKSFVLTESAGSKNQKRTLIVTVEGIHTGMTKNKTFYPGSALEESVPTWTAPHEKPVIKNHNISSEPLGRIVNAEYVESTLVDKYTVRLKLSISDQDAIEKILDGRYKTLSVGGSANRVNCSICGKDLVQEGWCGHSRGRKYEGKEAYWTIGNYTGDEISFVNMPADVYSQVIAAELVQGEGGETMKGGKAKEGAETNPQDPKTVTESELDMIDNLLGEDNDGEGEGVKTNESENEGDNPENPEGGQKTEEGDKGEGGEETLEEKVARLERELQEANGKLETAEADVLTLTADLKEANESLEEKDKHLKAAEQERDTFKNQSLTLARYARRSLAERVVDLRIMQGKNKADERDALLEQWGTSSTKVLESQINDLLESGKRVIAHVENPGLAVKDNNSNTISVDENDNELAPVHKESAEKPKIRTMKDLSAGMVGYMSRNY